LIKNVKLAPKFV